MKENLSQYSPDKCPECGNKIFYLDDKRAEICCSGCGLVIQQKIINPGPEWREYNNKNKVRTGPLTNLAIQDKGLCTIIGRDKKDVYNNEINFKKRAEIKRLRKWDSWSKSKRTIDRNLNNAMFQLDKIASLINLPDHIKQDSAYIYRKIVKKKITKGRSILELLLASVYAACKQNNIPKTFDDLIVFDDNLKKKRLSKYFRLIVSVLGLENKPISPKIFVSKFCSELNLSGNTTKLAVKIIDLADSKLVSGGKVPQSIAGAAIYAATVKNNERKSQKEISVVAGVSVNTIRNRYNELKKKLNLESYFIT